MPYKYAKLSGRIVEKYGTRERFAVAADISVVALSNKMNGKTGFSQKDIVKWAELLDISSSDYAEYFFA